MPKQKNSQLTALKKEGRRNAGINILNNLSKNDVSFNQSPNHHRSCE